MGNRELIRKEIHKQSGREARKRFFFCYQKAGRWVLAVLIVILTAVNVAFGAINLSSRKGNGGDRETPPVNEDHGETLPGNSDPVSEEISNDPRYEVIREYRNLGIVFTSSAYLNIRETPDINGKNIGKAMRYTVCEILSLSDDGEWYRIESDGQIGYLKKEYLKTGEEGMILAMEHCDYRAYPKKDKVHVTALPETSGELRFDMLSGNGYQVIETIGNWVKVHITNGLEGYSPLSELDLRYSLEKPFFYAEDFSKISGLRLDIINYAFEWYGGEYVWGGTTLGEGVDCSGYTLRIFEHFGIRIPRLSVEQSEWGTEVRSVEEALPGDLLFFVGYHDNHVTEGVGHVAIYLGNGKMIHAASEERGIVMDNYDYYAQPLCIRNVID